MVKGNFNSLWRSRYLPVLVIGLTLAIFGVTLACVTRHLRQEIRQQLISRDGEILQAVAFMQYAADAETFPDMTLAEPAEQMSVVLKTSRLKGVIAARLFDAAGQFITSVPANFLAGTISAADQQSLRKLQFISRFYDEAKIANLFLTPPTMRGQAPTAPILEVFIPLFEKDQAKLLGVAQFFIDGQGLAVEFAELDQNLWKQSLAAFGVGSLIIVAGLGWALRRLQRTNVELSALASSLTRANQELALAAKTSAVGAVAAHLIHGLKSPLFGLHSLISSRVGEATKASEPDWEIAVKTTRQLQQMVNEVAKLLQGESQLDNSEIRLVDAIGLMTEKLRDSLAAGEVKLAPVIETDARLTDHKASLVMIILENLVRNAIQATPAGRTVKLLIKAGAAEVICEVIDEGAGLPEAVRQFLFLPCQSTKAGGLGIGLAISKHLANHLGATLELKSSTPAGCAFVFAWPAQPIALPGQKMALANSNLTN